MMIGSDKTKKIKFSNDSRSYRSSSLFLLLSASIIVVLILSQHAKATETSQKVTNKKASHVVANTASLKQQRSSTSQDDDWNYLQQNQWDRVSAECGPKSRRQSPINVVSKDSVYDPHLSLELINYDQPVEFIIKNTHHSVQLKPVFIDPPGMLGQPSAVRFLGLDAQSPIYDLVQIHFHWGAKHEPGSEHLFDSHRSAAEMHLVHKQRDNKKQDGIHSLLVIGVIIEEEPSKNDKFDRVVQGVHNVNGTDDEYFARITTSGTHNNNNNHIHLNDLQESDVTSSNSVIDDMYDQRLMALLPGDIDSFFLYNGSLTTPPCHEVVTWILMRDPVYMGRQQLNELTELYAPRNKKISSNYRHIQPLGERLVYASFPASARPAHTSHGSSRPSGANSWFGRFPDNLFLRRQSRSLLLDSLAQMHMNHRNLNKTETS